MKLQVKHDTFTYDVVVNGVECTFCGYKEHESETRSIGDVDMCQACFEGMVA